MISILATSYGVEFRTIMMHDFFLLRNWPEIDLYSVKVSKIKLIEFLQPLENKIISSAKSNWLICRPFYFIQKGVNTLLSDTLSNF